MNRPVLLAAVATVAAALPIGALAQEGTPPQPGCATSAEAPRADSALPARASTKPEPQLGTVAPGTRVPSHTSTPSSRAMAAAAARAEKTDEKEKNATDACPGEAKRSTIENGSAKPEAG
jgi:hypothetical protein